MKKRYQDISSIKNRYRSCRTSSSDKLSSLCCWAQKDEHTGLHVGNGCMAQNHDPMWRVRFDVGKHDANPMLQICLFLCKDLLGKDIPCSSTNLPLIRFDFRFDSSESRWIPWRQCPGTWSSQSSCNGCPEDSGLGSGGTASCTGKVQSYGFYISMSKR